MPTQRLVNHRHLKINTNLADPLTIKEFSCHPNKSNIGHIFFMFLVLMKKHITYLIYLYLIIFHLKVLTRY